MVISIHKSPRYASFILTLSFLTGYVFIKLCLINYFSIEYLIRVWLAICVAPLFILAYIQNSYKKDKVNLNPKNVPRIKTKSLILLLQIVLLLAYASIITELGVANYSTLIDDMFFSFPIIIVFIVIYVYFVDRRLINPIDEYAQIGNIINNEIPINREMLKSFLLKTAVKVVFIPFMYSGFLGNLSLLLNTPWQLHPKGISLLLFNFGISIDMLIGIFGYLFSSAIINNQIVDTDNNFMGWFFALMCYPPLVWIMNQINNQQDNLIWSDIIPQGSLIFWIVFILINLTWIIYWLATFEFGMTFSNLSYRRLINKGVYRYTKHPAYISKNIYWWLYTLPFMGVAFMSAEWWKNILGLIFVSLIYYGRAKSEERHLMKFAEYRAYSFEIDQKGIFRWLKLKVIY